MQFRKESPEVQIDIHAGPPPPQYIALASADLRYRDDRDATRIGTISPARFNRS